MSVEAAAVYGALAGGVLALVIGLWAGVYIGRYPREGVKVHCVVSDWETMENGAPDRVICQLGLDLYNEGPSPTGLGGLCVEFVLRDRGRRVVSRLRTQDSDEKLSVLNLPPKQWVHSRLCATFTGKEALILAGLRRGSPWWVDFVGYFPDGSELRQKIIERKNYFASYSSRRQDQNPYARPWGRPLIEEGMIGTFPRVQSLVKRALSRTTE